VTRGVDFFRSVVIEALGDYKGPTRFGAHRDRQLDGPAAGRCRAGAGEDRRQARARDARGAPAHGAARVQPAIAAAICLLGVNCESHLGFLAARRCEFADRIRASRSCCAGGRVGALAALAVAGNAEAAETLIDVGGPSQDPARAPDRPGARPVALRNTPLLLEALEARGTRRDGPAIDCCAEGFDMLEEDLEEERFFVAVRRAYWQAPEGSPHAGRRDADRTRVLTAISPVRSASGSSRSSSI
jgi:hypothetical protein